MAIDDKINYEKLQHAINKKKNQQKYQDYHQAKSKNMNILETKNITSQSNSNYRS